MGYRPHDRKFGRLTVYGNWSNLTRPRVKVTIEQEYVSVAFALEDGGSDPWWEAHLDLTGSRIGDWLLHMALTYDQWKGMD
jgi:hypothetical protein